MDQDLPAPLLIALAAALAAFGLAWLIRSLLANRALERFERATAEEIRSLGLASNQLRAQLARLTEDLTTARSELAVSQDATQRLGAELEVQLRALDEARNQRNFLELELGRVQVNAARLTERIEQLAPLGGRVEALDNEVAAERGRTGAIVRKLEEVVAQKKALESDRSRLAGEVEALGQQLREAARAMSEESERRARQLDGWQAERAKLRIELADADERHRGVLAVLQETQQAREEARSRIRAVEIAAQARDSEREAAIGALEAQVARLDPLRRQLEDRELLVRVLAAERDARSAELDQVQRAATDASGRRDARIRALETEQVELNQVRARLAELEPKLSKATRERDQLAATLQRYVAELETQKAEAKDRDARFRMLAEEFRGTTSARDQEIAGLKAHMEGLEAQLQNGPASIERFSSAGTLLADDLKRIRGIGPTLERVLNAEGVYLYRQIATWTAEDVARIAERLRAFPDRIHRDEWIASARTEHVRKYGEEP
jgi:predicted flap endonuclease-1-like 5' DNA nuclease